MKNKERCPWAYGASPLYIPYHDKEWGRPVRDDRTQFEFLTLESAQAGLSWATVLNKREGYRRAFAGFDPVKVARFTPERIEKIEKALLQIEAKNLVRVFTLKYAKAKEVEDQLKSQLDAKKVGSNEIFGFYL